MHHLLFILVCLIWGTSFILMKRASLAFGPVGIAAWRMLSGAAALGAVWWLVRRGAGAAPAAPPLRRAHLKPMVLVIVLGYVIPFVVQPYVIHRYNGSALMGVFMSLVPLLTMAVSVPMLRVYPARRQVAGVALGLAFLALLLGDAWRGQVSLAGLLLAASVPLSYSIANTYVKVRFSDTPALALSCAALGLGGLLVLPVSLLFEPVRMSDDFVRAAGSLALLGVVCTGLATYMFYRLIQRHGPLYAGMVTYVIPIVAVLWGWSDGERIGRWQLVALAGILASVALVQWPGRRAASTAGVLAPPD